jgi:hypothetical protein
VTLLLLALAGGVLGYLRVQKLVKRQETSTALLRGAGVLRELLDPRAPTDELRRKAARVARELDALSPGQGWPQLRTRLHAAVDGGDSDEMRAAARELNAALLSEADRTLRRAGKRTAALGDNLLQGDYYRLNVLAVRVLSLRERREEIVPLAEHFLRNTKVKGLRFADRTLRYVAEYDWPGNVRELRNVVERMAVTAEGEVLEPEDLPREIRAPPARGSASPRSLAEAERRHILRVLEAAGGNKKKAAELLEISPTTLYSKLKAYGDG